MDLTTFFWPAVTIGGYIVAGGLAISSMFNSQRNQQREDADSTATNLINNLKTTTELQEKEIGVLRGKEIEQGKEIAHLQGQVKVLAEILQGRDPAMQSFLTNAPELLRIAKENNGYAKLNSEAVTNLTKAITNLLTTITPKKDTI